MPRIRTFGQNLPGMFIECITDPCNANRLSLHTWNGKRAATAHTVEHLGKRYIPGVNSNGLVKCVRFSPSSVSYRSTAGLVAEMRDLLTKYAHLQPEARDLLVAFALASWFCDAMSSAPVLQLFGPDSEVSLALRLLACCCRRSVLLSDVDLESLATLPEGLAATLLINQRQLAKIVKRAFSASKRRHFSLVRGGREFDLYGAKAFPCDVESAESFGLRVSISPAPASLPTLTDAAEQEVAQHLQSRLLRYRMVNHERIRTRTISCDEFVPELRQEARAWLAPIYDCDSLSKSVFEEILRQSSEIAGARFADPRCLVVEAALFYCHKADSKQFFVGDLAETVEVLMKGRHEEADLSPRRIGAILREVGLQGKRVAQGYRISLNNAVRTKIHQLAIDFQVASLHDGVQRCNLCPPEVRSPSRIH